MTKRFDLHHILLAVVITALCAFAGGTAVASDSAPQQRHMEAALTYLHQALQELNAAAADKGGHRNQAINAVQTAINQTKAGMNAASQ